MNANAVLGWILAAAALAAGWLQGGWRGLALGVTVVVFWLLLQFGRVLRTMRAASARPVGRVDSAVMLQARLRPGLTLLQVIDRSGSLGERLDDGADRWRWRDDGGAAVVIDLERGRLSRWSLQRDADAEPAAQAGSAAAASGSGNASAAGSPDSSR